MPYRGRLPSGAPAEADTAGPPAARAAAARPRGLAGATRGRTLLGTTLFVLGFSLVFATEGLAFGGLGLVLVRHQAGVTQILAGSRSCWDCCSPGCSTVSP